MSFTFGLPPRETVDALHRVGTRVAVSVASVDDARLALALGPDSLVVQGTQAGGHRATLSASEDANETPTLDLVRAIVPLGVPVVAAGGIACGSDIADALAAGARAVQLGTAFLLTPEAGTSTAHRAALRDPSFTATRVSRAYTGRPARGLDNALGRLDAPASYPAVHQLTGPIRRAAAASGDLQHTHLWAGTGWRSVREEPAAEVVTRLWAEASAQA